MEKNKFLVCSMTRWVGDDFAEALAYPLYNEDTNAVYTYDLVRDMGLDQPPVPVSEVVGAWLPAAHATRLRISGYDLPLTAPGPKWLSRVQSLNPELLGREVLTMRAKDVKPVEGFWKVAEAKLPYFDAKWRTKEEIQEDIKLLHPQSWVQYTPTFLEIAREERFFIERLGENTFLVDRSTYSEGDWIYYQDLESRVADQDSLNFVMAHLKSFAKFSPQGYVIDTATLTNGKTVILEANPAWCSAAYACDMQMVYQTIIASMSNPYPQYDKWIPDSSLIRDAHRKPLLRAR